MRSMANLLQKSYPIIFITIVVLIMASLCTLTESLTRAGLELQQEQQALEMLQQIFPEVGHYIYDEETEIYTVYDTSKNQIGYAFYAEGKSYYGPEEEDGYKVAALMVILVGLEDKEVIKGIVVVEHAEDPQYWKIVVRLNFFSQFNGLKIEDCVLREHDGSGGEVDAVTTATLSSLSMVDIVRETALEKVESIS